MIVNTSRGPIIHTESLIKGLQNSKILAAGLDVIEDEPVTKENKILEFENVILTPHVSFKTEESTRELHRRVAETACKVLNGELPNNILNRS
ncbi:NAD(P)-dependent oxidoreductase [Bacillus sp. JJ1566]|uniref:NAD(P)-dependent oxidoreductase n=1 Tax=Bacillus sp. JJ1566 TaxID=3122961 RepID=UPI003000F80D